MSDEFGDSNQAEVYLDTFKGQKAIIKRAIHPGVPLLSHFEQWMIHREARALRVLDDLNQVPDFLGFPDEYSIAMEYCPGTLLRHLESHQLQSNFFEELETLVESIHRRGIVHSDLKKQENVMVGEDGGPILIDFGTHFQKKDGFRPIYGFLYRQFKQMDLNAVSKLKRTFCPEAVEEKDLQRLDSPTFLERADRFRRRYLFD
jgi:serine/threonine protein kinase